MVCTLGICRCQTMGARMFKDPCVAIVPPASATASLLACPAMLRNSLEAELCICRALLATGRGCLALHLGGSVAMCGGGGVRTCVVDLLMGLRLSVGSHSGWLVRYEATHIGEFRCIAGRSSPDIGPHYWVGCSSLDFFRDSRQWSR